jgi:transcription elongation GreA/GreB family factor
MKEKILVILHEMVQIRIQNAKKAMDAAQESANSEGKSSAGDKYETSRAMGQIDRDMYAKQLVNAQNERDLLLMIDVAKPSLSVGFGSLIETSAGAFFISISVGKVDIEGKAIMAVSQKSPIGLAMNGKKLGETFPFLGKNHTILQIV